jgi:hypothetical protein
MRGLNFPLAPALQNALFSEWPKIYDRLHTVLGAVKFCSVSEEGRTGLPMLKLFLGVAHVPPSKSQERAGETVTKHQPVGGELDRLRKWSSPTRRRLD